MRSAFFGKIYFCARFCCFFDGVDGDVEKMREVSIHHRFHNFCRFGKTYRAREIFRARAQTFFLTSAKDDGAEVALFDQLTAKEKCTDTRRTVDLMCADAEKVDVLRFGKRNSHKALNRIAMDECCGASFFDDLRRAFDVVYSTRFIVYKHKGCKAYAFLSLFFDSFKIECTAFGGDIYNLKSARCEDSRCVFDRCMLGIGNEYPL